MSHTEAKADRSKEMLAHAIDIVRESGLSSLTMKKVAGRVGFTETAAYRYFPNKQALLLALADELGVSLVERMRSIARSDASPADRLTRMLRHHIDFVLQLDGLPVLILAEAASSGNKDLVARFGAIMTGYMTDVASVIKEMPASDGSVHPEELALIVMGIPAVLAIQRRIGADHVRESRIRSKLVPFVVSSLSQSSKGDGK